MILTEGKTPKFPYFCGLADGLAGHAGDKLYSRAEEMDHFFRAIHDMDSRHR